MQMQIMPIHPLTGLTALGFRKDGRPIWPVMGASEQSGEEGDGDQGGLLDDEAENGGDDGQGTGGDQGGDEQGGGNVDQQAIVDAVVKALEGQFDSIADRRVNAILKEVRKQQGQQGGESGGTGDQGGSTEQRVTGPAASDVREARLVYREYVGDGFRFLGDVEREHAATLAQALIPGMLAKGDDPEEAGRKAARQVQGTLRDLRKHYENKTLQALRRKGAIPEDGRGPGPSPTGPGTRPGAVAGYQAGAAKAHEILGNRMPQTQNQ